MIPSGCRSQTYLNRALKSVLFATLFLPLSAIAQFECQAFFGTLPSSLMAGFMNTPTLNTSNPGKQMDYSMMGSNYKINWNFSSLDIDEPQSDPLKVAVFKASKFLDSPVPVLVEDQRLDIDGEEVGVNLKQMLRDGNIQNYEGKRATWVSLIAIAWQGKVYIFEGQVSGRMTSQGYGEGPSFHNFFIPDNANHSLGENLESYPEGKIPYSKFDARHLALKNLLRGNIQAIGLPITNWLSLTQEEYSNGSNIEDPNWMFNLNINGEAYSLTNIGTGEASLRQMANRVYGAVAVDRVTNPNSNESFEFETPQEELKSTEPDQDRQQAEIDNSNFRDQELIQPAWIEKENILTDDYSRRVVFYNPQDIHDAKKILLLKGSEFTRSEARKSFAELIQLYHNDRLGLSEGTEEFLLANQIHQIIHQAWSTISESMKN